MGIDRFHRMASTLAATAEIVSAPRDEHYNEILARHAAEGLGLDHVHVARLRPDRTSVETLAVHSQGKPSQNWTYALSGTPCEGVIGGARRCIPEGVRTAYPLDDALEPLCAEGYIGEPILSARGEVLGLVVAITTTPIRDAEIIQANLRILAASAGAEMEQRRALEALREERDTARSVLQTVEAVIVCLDPDGQIRLINRKGCQLLGYEERELIGASWLDLCVPDSHEPQVRRAFTVVLSGHLNGQEYVESPILTRSGEQRLIAWHNAPHLGPDGQVVGTLSAGLDVTERRMAERQRAESEQELRSFANAGQALIWAAAADKRCYFFNDVWLAFTGRALEKEQGEGWTERVHPDDVDRCLQIYHEAFDRREKFSMEYRLLRHDGQYRWLQDDGCPRYDSEGRFVGYIGFCLDITQARNTRDELRSRERYQKALLDNFPFSVWLKDEAGRYLAVNQAFAASVGIDDPRRLVGRMDTEVFPSEIAEHCRREDLQVMQTREKLHTEEERPGSERPQWRETYKAPVLAEDGELLGTVGFTRDIGRYKRAELELAKQREQLRLILDHAPIGIWLLSPSGQMEFANRTFSGSTGISEERLLEADYYGDLLEEPYRSQWAYSDAKAMAQSEVLSTRAQLPFVDGEVHDLQVIKFAKRDARGEPEALVGLCLDITEELRKEAALRESEAKFHTMVDWTYDWEYWLLPDGKVCYMTPSAERFTGFTVAELEADPGLIDAMVHPEDRALWDGHLSAYETSAGDDGICQLDFRILQKGGETLWVTHRCRPVFDEDGRYRGRRVTVSDIDERKAAEEQIRHLAYFDPLTGLPNRRLLLDRLGHALSTSNRSRRYGALLMLDLDHFKSLNDTKGHDAGDRLLTEVAKRMKAVLREQDTVSRLGGDEYVVMLEELGAQEETAATEAETVAEKIRGALNQPYDILPGEPGHYCTPSIGVTLFRGHDTSVEGLLKQADVALYQAKDAGRNTVRFFNPEMQTAIERRMQLEAALRHALGNGELELHFQPQIDQQGRCIGAEALLRWDRPGHGVVCPLQFIPLAEETGLILPIGDWVVSRACAQLKVWEADARTCELQLAINVSARQFNQPNFVRQVRDCLDHSGANPSRLKLELTESAFLEHAEKVGERMQELKDLGVGFSLDDFGTGYSSLSYLKRLPFDQLKIDQTFVRDITTDPNDAAIVMAILAMSRSLGLEIIAEGVETEAQRELLQSHGCHAFQGYLFGKPIPVDRLHDVIWA